MTEITRAFTKTFSIAARADEAEVVLYDVIDPYYGISAAAVHEQLKAVGDVKRIRVRINSPGGSVFDGTAIYNILRAHPARKIVSVDGLAASMASIVAMAGDEIEMGEGAYMMVHDPLGVAVGDSAEMRDVAELLDRMKTQLVGIYARRTGRSEAEIAQLMQDETWMSAREAVAGRFADRVVPGLAVAARFFDKNPGRFRNVPASLLNQGAIPMSEEKLSTPGPATYQELKATFPKGGSEFITSQLDASATMDQARAAYQAMLEKRAEAAETKAAAAEAAVQKARADAEAKAKAVGQGVPPIGGNAGNSDDADGRGQDPIVVFNALVDAHVAKGLARGKAISRVVREHPEAHAAYLAAHNRAHGRS
jgi:ATP-dependent Clp endopeptidase proteolytic subunit ClpP